MLLDVEFTFPFFISHLLLNKLPNDMKKGIKK